MVPIDASLYMLDFEAVGTEGHPLAKALVHHINLQDPRHRELFLPIARRMMAMRRETPRLAMSSLLLGYPVRRD